MPYKKFVQVICSKGHEHFVNAEVNDHGFLSLFKRKKNLNYQCPLCEAPPRWSFEVDRTNRYADDDLTTHLKETIELSKEEQLQLDRQGFPYVLVIVRKAPTNPSEWRAWDHLALAATTTSEMRGL